MIKQVLPDLVEQNYFYLAMLFFKSLGGFPIAIIRVRTTVSICSQHDFRAPFYSSEQVPATNAASISSNSYDTFAVASNDGCNPRYKALRFKKCLWIFLIFESLTEHLTFGIHAPGECVTQSTCIGRESEASMAINGPVQVIKESCLAI